MDAKASDIAQIEQYLDAAEAITGDSPIALSVNGKSVELPASGNAVIQTLLAALAAGEVKITATPRTLTLAQAAPLLWMSEDELLWRIEIGWIPAVDGQLMASDVIAARPRRAAFIELMRLGDDEPDVPLHSDFLANDDDEPANWPTGA